MEKLTVNGGGSFRIRRPLITTNGFVSEVDPNVKDLLDDLDELLAKRVFETNNPEAAEELAKKAAAKGNGEGANGDSRREHGLFRSVEAVLSLPLKPRATNKEWPAGSLAHALANKQTADNKLSLADYIDQVPKLSELKYGLQVARSSSWWLGVPDNVKAVLDEHPAIADYLVSRAFQVGKVTDINGLKNFILNNRLGARQFIIYGAVSAARILIHKEKLNVAGVDNDDSAFINAIEVGDLALSSASFTPAVRSLLKDLVFDNDIVKLIESAGLTRLPVEIRPQLIKVIKASVAAELNPTAADVKSYANALIAQSPQSALAAGEAGEDTESTADTDFNVAFFEDDQALVQVSAAAVKCAAQLYYGMVLGDELNVFDAMNYFAHKYLLRESIEISNRQLRDDLQLYVFSGKFIDLATNKVTDRTRPAERKMFYRQVFNQKGGEVSEDLVVNHEFPRLWKLLILESANYLERARESFNPDGYVSKQSVMQAVEDLQYNLSTHCTGMSNVVTPLIYAELDFIVRRIFMHKEILRQVVPSGGTWWRVIETLYLAMKGARPKSTVLYNKAKLGHEILKSIATYNPASFENDQTFSAFISTVDAFITTQSILQAALTEDLKRTQNGDADEEASGDTEGDEDGEPGSAADTARKLNLTPPGPPPAAYGKGAPVDAAAGAEWDF